MLTKVFEYWDSDKFSDYIKSELSTKDVELLPLEKCCTYSAVIDENSISIMVISKILKVDSMVVKVGVFFQEILSGCACSDDPSQAMTHENSYCEINIIINKSGEVEFVNAS